MLSSPLKFTVKGPPLTASFESVPTSHTGSGEFRFRIAFSEAPKSGFSYTTMRDHAFTVTGGSVTGARRLVSGKNLRWEIVVSPDSNGDVTITLPATTDCDAQGAICTDDDRPLSNRLELTVSGPGGTPVCLHLGRRDLPGGGDRAGEDRPVVHSGGPRGRGEGTAGHGIGLPGEHRELGRCTEGPAGPGIGCPFSGGG